VVFAAILAVVYVALVDKAVPPVAAAYQATEPPTGAVADRVTVPGPHLATPTADGAVGNAFIVAITAMRVGETQPVLLLLDSK
jgi:hypothetical protein